MKQRDTSPHVHFNLNFSVCFMILPYALPMASIAVAWHGRIHKHAETHLYRRKLIKGKLNIFYCDLLKTELRTPSHFLFLQFGSPVCNSLPLF